MSKHPKTLRDFIKSMESKGKAFVYNNKNWKAYVTVLLSSPEEMEEGVRLVTGNPESSVRGISGFSSSTERLAVSAGTRGYLMWVNDRNGNDTVSALAHEAVHISGLILADCGVSVDLKDVSASECLAYLVEDIVKFGLNCLKVNLPICTKKDAKQERKNQ